MFIEAFAGSFFPLSFLPIILYKISQCLPFMYTFFIPVQFFLGKINNQEAIKGLFIELFWCFVLYFIIKKVYKIGLKKYEGVGI